jgi:hypothetical protein
LTIFHAEDKIDEKSPLIKDTSSAQESKGKKTLDEKNTAIEASEMMHAVSEN